MSLVFQKNEWAFSLIWVFLCLSWQPGIIGQNISSVLSVLVLIILAIETQKRVDFFEISLGVYLALMPMVYFAIKMCVAIDGSPINAFKSMALAIVGYLYLFVGLSRYSIRKIGVSFVVILLILCGSMLLSYFVYGPNIAIKQPYFSFEIKKYNSMASIYFPFTLVYEQHYGIFSIQVLRCIGMFREPGVFQAFLCAGILTSAIIWSDWKSHFFAILLSVGVIATMSTSGMMNLLITIPAYFLCRYKAKAIVPVSLMLFFSTPFVVWMLNLEAVGLFDKLSGDSGSDRVKAFNEFAELFWKAGMWGLNGGGDETIESSTGTFLIFYLKYGAFGTFLSIIPHIYLYSKARFNVAALVMLPLVVTALTSQPLWGTLPFITISAITARLSRSTD